MLIKVRPLLFPLLLTAFLVLPSYTQATEKPITIPAEANPGHLYTRIGKKVVDYSPTPNGKMNVSDYNITTDRLETFFMLKPNEMIKLREYLHNIINTPKKTLAGFIPINYYGPIIPPKGLINDNKVILGGHNCTSWLCTAPIGRANQSILSQVYGEWGWWTSRSPRKWLRWLNLRAPQSRSPFSVYWTGASFDYIKDTVVHFLE